ncbi:MAG: hypothetical protein JWO02_549 [Solirubrobacterales bacterium]|nr:hypothetical protein [Solirubrobacterales bacterium]
MSFGFELVEVSRRPTLGLLSVGAPPGAVTALVGPRPAGRTAFRLAAGLDRSDTGAVLVAGEDISTASSRGLRKVQRRMAVVFEAGPDASYALFAGASVADNIRYAITVAGRASRRRVDAQVAQELDRYRIGQLAAAVPGELTAGQRKLVALARATALRSPLLLIDEIEADLDDDATDLVAAILRERTRDMLGACLLTTADPAAAKRLADQVVLLEDDTHPLHPAR